MVRGHDSDDAGNDILPGETEGTSSLLGRRSYLQLSGAAAAAGIGSAIGAGSAVAATTRHGITFEREVDATEFGADPSGSSSSDAALDEAAGANTLVRFPEGNYRFTRRHVFKNMGAVGIVGDGDVTFTVPGGFNSPIAIFRTTNAVLENVDIDQTASNCATGFKLLTDGDFHVGDVEFHGRGVHSDQHVTRCFAAQVHDPSATGTFENVTAIEGSGWALYKGAAGRIGCHIGPSNAGTIRFVNVHFEEFGNNAIYASASGGPVQVEDSLFRNNNVASVRFGGAGCHVKNTVIENEIEKYSGPRTQEDREFNLRCIVWEQKKAGNASRDGGGLIENCDLRIGTVPRSAAAIEVWGDGPGVTLRNNRIQVDRDGTPHVSARTPDGGPHEVPPKPWAVEVLNTSLTGSGGGTAAVRISGRPNSVVEGCCFQLSGANSDGVQLQNSDGSTVRNSTINVAGQTVAGGASTDGITESGTCPVPSLSGDSDPDRELTIASDRWKANYEFSVDGDLEKSEANDATIDDHDGIEDATATGHVWGGRDSYRFSGEITDFSVDGPVTVLVDGEEVDPAALASDLPNAVTIRSESEKATYEFSVDGDLEKSVDDGATIDDGDGIEDGTASGLVWGWRDSYRFSGEFTDFSVDGPVTVLVDGEEVDPASLA